MYTRAFSMFTPSLLLRGKFRYLVDLTLENILFDSQTSEKLRQSCMLWKKFHKLRIWNCNFQSGAGKTANVIVGFPKFSFRANCLANFPEILTLRAGMPIGGSGVLFFTTAIGLSALPRVLERWLLSTIEKIPRVSNSVYPTDRVIGTRNPLKEQLRYAWTRVC